MFRWLSGLFPALVLCSTPALALSAKEIGKKIATLKAPKGFKVSLFAAVPDARSLTLGPDGWIFAGTRTGTVYGIQDKNGDGVGETIIEVAEGLSMPNGVAYNGGDLFVAEINRVIKFPKIAGSLPKIPKMQVVNDKFPTDKHHGWKYIAFGPDGKLYVPVGAPCNICNTDADPKTSGKYARIFRMNRDGSGLEEFARGVRNTVGFDWHPNTKELWFTDNGRDHLGNNIPPDELNRAPKKGLHFGYPFVHGENISDPEFGGERPKRERFIPPVVTLGPHVAALGMKFYTGNDFPDSYRHLIFIAEHGSWNRDKKIGYRVTTVGKDKKGKWRYEPFITGWLGEKDTAWGRPVDVLINRDGSLLISDDEAGAIYRVTHGR